MSGVTVTGHDALVERLASDLDAAFEDLVVGFQDRLFGFALRCSGSREDAEEIAQDAFVRAYRALGSYPAERIKELRVAPWLFQIALNVWRNRTRRATPHVVSMNGRPDPALESHADRVESSVDLAALLTCVSDRARAVLVLRFVEGLSTEETAEVIGRPAGTVKSDVHRGLAQLRSAFERSMAKEER